MKKVILARPSSLIVSDMKNLISSTGLEATPIRDINELVKIDHQSVGGIVISTALSSIVKEQYWEVIKRSAALFPKRPIFLASYANVRSTKITAGSRIEKYGLDYELLSVDEAKSSRFDSEKHILILTQKEISNPVLFPSISDLMTDLLKPTIPFSAT